jgi:AraC-like DNA-binding protein
MFETFRIRSRPELSVYRPINNVAVIVRVAGLYGLDPRKLLEGSHIDIADVEDPHKIITTLQELHIERRGIQLIPEPWIGLELGRHFHLGAKGKLGIAAMCCENGVEALQLLITYIDLASTHFQYDIWTEGKTGFARMRELIGFKDMRRYICEAEMASLYTMTSLIMEDAAVFKELHIAYPAPAYADRYRELFHCPVVFGAPHHLIVFNAELLYKPLKLANPLAKKMLEQECAQLSARLREHTSISDKIRHELSFGAHDYPTLEQLARRINLSPRTIRRHLTTEATSYKDILSDLRRSQALEMIQSTDLPMEKIALKLGYSDVANFYHAFKGWTGSTPGSYRKAGTA